MTLYYCSTPPVWPHPPPTLIIAAPSFFDAKAYATRQFGSEGLIIQPTGDDAIPDVELRWSGDDYGAGGTPNGRRLQVRRRGEEQWKDDGP